jgi:hypothetical protein
MRGRNFRKTHYGWFLSIKSKYEESYVFVSIANLTINCLGL